VFFPFALGYFLSYALRTVNAIIAPPLTAELSLTAASLGFLTAAYFLAFATMQVPLGRWLDRYPPRKVEAALLVCAATGTGLFALAENIFSLVLARALIGAGVCCCLMASFRTYTLWLPKENLPVINGLQLAIGSVGAIVFTAPVQSVLPIVGWRGLFWGLGGLLLVCALWLQFATPDPANKNENVCKKPTAQFSPMSAERSTPAESFSAWKSPIFWTLMPFAALNASHGMSMQALWASPWLLDVAGVSRPALGYTLAMLNVGFLLGNLGGGLLASALTKRGVLPHQLGFVLCLVALVVQVPLLLSWTGMPALWLFLFGLFNSSGNLVFASTSYFFPAHAIGRTFASFNLAMFALVFVVQWGTGLIVNAFPNAGGGYASTGYVTAFGLIALLQTAALIWYLSRRHLLKVIT
jgi:predicted MFS family arabinose efflux permease